MTPRVVSRALDGLWLVALAIYVLVGVDAAPFHGDESSTIFQSGDYYYLAQARDLDRLRYADPPLDAAEQHLRLLNGPVGKYAVGIGWDLAGLTVADLNQQWVWGAGWDWNVADGHLPSDRLLRAARLSSAVLLAISAWAVFGAAWLVTRSRAAAWIASAVYITTPAVLLNGRRAIFEGALLAFLTLAALAALALAREQARPDRTWRRLALGTAALGVLCGLAVASKHSAAIGVAAFFAALITEPLVRPEGNRVAQLGPALARLAGAGLLALVTFLALNPAWWSDPLRMPGRALDARRALLDGQVAAFGGYDSALDAAAGLVDNLFLARPQYYEAPEWADYAVVAGQIARYDGAWYAGRGGGPVWGLLLVVGFAIGGSTLARCWREGPVWTLLAWVSVTAGLTLALTPLDWQRYYLALYPPVAVIIGAGAGRGLSTVWGWRHAAA